MTDPDTGVPFAPVPGQLALDGTTAPDSPCAAGDHHYCVGRTATTCTCPCHPPRKDIP